MQAQKKKLYIFLGYKHVQSLLFLRSYIKYLGVGSLGKGRRMAVGFMEKDGNNIIQKTRCWLQKGLNGVPDTEGHSAPNSLNLRAMLKQKKERKRKQQKL